MGWISAIAVLVMIATAGGLWAFVIAPLKRPTARGPFLVGVLCGVTVGIALTARRRGLNALGACTLRAVLGPPRAGSGISRDGRDGRDGLDGLAARALTAAAAAVRHLPTPSRVFRQTQR